MIKPLPGYLLVEPIQDDSKSGEIYLPETSKDKPSKGKTIQVGQFDDRLSADYRSWHNVLRPNLVVFYKKWTNQEIEYEGKKYLFVAFNELLGVEE